MAVTFVGGRDGEVGFQFETLTISTVAKILTAATYSDTSTDVAAVRRNATSLVLSVETNPIRVRWDGTAPTASVGLLLSAGDILQLQGNGNIKNLQLIRQGAADATIMVMYSRR